MNGIAASPRFSVPARITPKFAIRDERTLGSASRRTILAGGGNALMGHGRF
jgi:hypothetical protein